MLKSTEIVIEQLIIGLLAIVIVTLFVRGQPLPPLISGGNAYQSFFFGVLLVLAAYAAGIVVDRWSDTLLEQLERRIRLQVYLESITYCQFFWSNTDSLPNEAALRLEIQKDDGGIADHHDYLRRRMRITRAITCLMPALFLAMALLDYRCDSQEAVRWAVGCVAFIFYAIFLGSSICLPKKYRDYFVPKTHPKYRLCHFLVRFKSNELLNYGSEHDKMRIEFRFRDLAAPLDLAMFGLLLFSISGIVLLVCLHYIYSPINTARIFMFIGGILVTCMVGWAWWRISNTFFTFLRNYDEFGRKKNSVPRHLFYE